MVNKKVIIKLPNISKEENDRRLEHLYDVCNEIFKDMPQCFIKDRRNI